eukprot:jgi/Galph1/3818/GphlegSOOS_G2449.1
MFLGFLSIGGVVPFTKQPHLRNVQFVAGRKFCTKRRWIPCSNGEIIRAEWTPEGLLETVVAEKWNQVEELKNSLPARKDGPLSLRLSYFSQLQSFKLLKTLKQDRGRLKVIGEMKRTTYGTKPKEKLEIAEILNPRKTGQELLQYGVDAISVATDFSVYSGTVFDLKEVVENVGNPKEEEQEDALPIIYKDVVLHPLQIALAKEAGAHAVVLIAAACLPDLPELLNASTIVGVDAIVECHNEVECEYAIEYGATILFLSNRSRIDGEMYMGTAERLRLLVPNIIATIGGGGIETKEEAFSLQDAGFDAVVLGRSLFRPNGFHLVRSIRERIVEEQQRSVFFL